MDDKVNAARQRLRSELVWPTRSACGNAYGLDGDAADRALDDLSAEILNEVTPCWEAVYEPGNVSDYLIANANSEAAAKGAAVAWVESETDRKAADLNWSKIVPGDRHADLWELLHLDADGVETTMSVTVRCRAARFTAEDVTLAREVN